MFQTCNVCARHGAHDAPLGQGPRRAEPDEADVPGALPAPAAADAAQGAGDHAQEGRGADRDAQIHARADAGSHAQGHGPTHAAHDRRRGAAHHPADDRLPAGEINRSCLSGRVSIAGHNESYAQGLDGDDVWNDERDIKANDRTRVTSNFAKEEEDETIHDGFNDFVCF